MTILSIIGIAVLVILSLILIKYLFPFFVRPLWFPITALWGYRIGRKRYKHLNMIYVPKIQNPQPSNNPVDIETLMEKFREQLEDIIKDEIDRKDKIRKDRSLRLTDNLNDNKEKTERVRGRISNQANISKGHFFGKVLSHFNSTFNKTTGKNLLFFISACVIIIIDTLIAIDIIESLGIFEKDVNLFGVPKGLLYFIGSFVTITVAMILHIILGPNFIKENFSEKFSGKVFAIITLVAFAALLTIMVFFPDQAKAIFEVVLRISWIFGVIAVYWLIGQIVTVEEEHDHTLLFVTISMFFIPILYPIFGLGFLFELLFSQAWNISCSIFLEAKKARIIKQQQNLDNTTEHFTNGLWRGAKSY